MLLFIQVKFWFIKCNLFNTIKYSSMTILWLLASHGIDCRMQSNCLGTFLELLKIAEFHQSLYS